jgi:hypothetical protein
VFHVRSGRGGSKGAEGNGKERELHICFEGGGLSIEYKKGVLKTVV